MCSLWSPLKKIVQFDNPCKKTHRKPPQPPGFSTVCRTSASCLRLMFWSNVASGGSIAPGGRQAEGGPFWEQLEGRWRVKSHKKNGSNKFYTVFFFNFCFYSILVLFGKVGMSEWNVCVDCSSEVSKEKTKETRIRIRSFLFCPHKHIPSKIPKQKTTEQKTRRAFICPIHFFPFR